MIGNALLKKGSVDRRWLLLLAGVLVLPACGNSGEEHPPLYPVKGKVTVSGQPMPVGTIIFEYAGEGPDAPKGVSGGPFRATAKIKDGAFNLNGYAGAQGMPAGKYKVGVLATQGRSEGGILGREVVIPKKGKAAASVKQYAEPKSSGLTTEVHRDQSNEPVFDLK